MRTTINIDDDLLERAQELTGESDRTRLVQTALKAMIEQEAARRLALLGGTMPRLEVPLRRRTTS